MHILFNEVPQEYQDTTHFVGQNTEFYTQLIVEDEDNENGTFRITDSVGRSVPFDFEQLDELVEVLQVLQEYRDDKNQFLSYWSHVFGG